MSDAAIAPTPKLSVTVLNYNYAHFLPQCLDSILSQSFTDFELIIIDDRSSDNSLEVLARYRDDPRVRIVAHDVNRGYVASLIEGTEAQSRGEYLTVISADDLVRSNEAFARQIALLDANREASFCFSAFDRFWSDDGSIIQSQHSFDGDQVVVGTDFARRYLSEMSVQVMHSGVIIRASAYRIAGRYRRDVRYAVDFSMWPLLALAGDVVYCGDRLYGYRVHRDQMSSSFKGVRASLLEMLSAIDMYCTRAKAQGIDVGDLRRDAVRCSLAAVALDDAFSGRNRLALTRVAVALRVRPSEAVMTKQLWVVVLRTILGERGFGVARGRLGKLAAG